MLYSRHAGSQGEYNKHETQRIQEKVSNSINMSFEDREDMIIIVFILKGKLT